MMHHYEIHRLSLLLNGMILFRDLTEDPVIHSLHTLLNLISAERFEPAEVYREYHHFCAQAVEVNWPDYLWDCVLRSENELTRQVEREGEELNAEALWELGAHDLKILSEIAQLTPEKIKEGIKVRLSEGEVGASSIWDEAPLSIESWPIWKEQPSVSPLWIKYDSSEAQEDKREGKQISPAERYLLQARQRVKAIFREGNPKEMVRALVSFYREVGSGIFSDFMAFKWQGRTECLEGIRPDAISKEQLINQEREQGIVLQNTEFFLAGYPANNIILYGNRGTGKSSLVKALLQEYYDRGLRLVELSKIELIDFPKVVRILANRPQKFILFIDDLSFEASEVEFKTLKTLLEGGLERKPTNIIIYATSNRRHLIKENFSDREGDEIFRTDNMEEKLSLADRFGITVTFTTPNQEGFLRIVEELASQEKIVMDREQLRQQALRWVMMHNGRSGRTARQFIDYLVASQGVAAK